MEPFCVRTSVQQPGGGWELRGCHRSIGREGGDGPIAAKGSGLQDMSHIPFPINDSSPSRDTVVRIPHPEAGEHPAAGTK